MDLAPLTLQRVRIPLLATLAGAACAPDRGACPEPCTTAVIAIPAQPDVLVPAFTRLDVGLQIGDQLFLRLAGPPAEGGTAGDAGFTPLLARTWAFEDSLTLVFTLHPDARWHDGVPVTAEDVAFTFALYRDTTAGASSGPQLARIAGVTARDEHTVAFRFRQFSFEQFFDATQHLRILPRHLLDTVPRDRLARHPFMRAPVGAGPYRLVRWENETVELVADTGFFLGRPGLDRQIWRVAPDPSARIAMLLAGAADIIPRIPGPEDADRIAAAADARLVAYPSLSYYYLSFNLRDPEHRDRPHPLLGDRALRRALARGIDREAILEAVLGGRGDIPRGPISPAVWAWADSLRQLPFDSAAARRALEDLGWRDADGDGVRERNGRPLAFDLLVVSTSAHRNRTAVIMQDQLRRLGVDLRIVGLEAGTWAARFEAGRYDATIGGRFIDPTPVGMLEFWTADAPYNAEGYRSARFDSLAHAAAAATALPRARQRWHEAIAALNEDAPGVWLYTPEDVAGLRPWLTDVTLIPGQWHAALWTWHGGGS